MEKRKAQSVTLKGVAKDKPQNRGVDGNCEELINLRYEDGAWRGVGMKTKLPYSVVSSRVYYKIVKPEMLPEGYFIGFCATPGTFYLIGTNLNLLSTETLIHTLATGDRFIDFAWMNNTLMIYSVSNAVALQFDPADNTFTELGDLLLPKLAVGEADALQEIVVNGSISPVEGNINEVSQDYFNVIRSEFLEQYAQKLKDGYFSGNVSFFFAYKMFDGNYIKHSGPYIWNVGWDNANYPKIERTYYAPPDDPTPFGAAVWTISAGLGRPTIYMEYAGDTGNVLEDYKKAGLIQSLCIFMSPDRAGHDVFEADITKWLYLSMVYQYQPPFDAEAYKSIPDAVNHFLVKEIGIDELIAQNTATGVKRIPIVLDKNQIVSLETNPPLPIDNFSSHKLVPSTTYLYNSRLHLGDISILPGAMQIPFIDWFYDAVADEYIFPTERSVDLTADYFGSGFTIVEDNSTILAGLNFFLHVEIESEGRTYQKTTPLALSDIRLFSKINVEPVVDYYVCVRPLSSYPDLRAKKWMLLVKSDADTHYKICEADYAGGSGVFELKPRTFSNTSMYNGDMQDFDDETYLPIYLRIPTDISTYNSLVNYDSPFTYVHNWHEPNRIQTSEVNNVFYYPAKQSYRVGNTDYTVRAMIVAQEPMTEMQFGQFPLYVFTAGGVFALEYGDGGEVLYSRITQFLSDIIREGVKPLVLSGGAIIFQELSSVKVLIGRQSKDVSDPVLSKSFNPLWNDANLIAITTDESISNVREKMDNPAKALDVESYLLKSRIAYDHRTKEVLFSKLTTGFLGGGDYTLVYQLETGTWYKRTEVFRDYIHSTGGHLAVHNSIAVDSLGVSTYHSELYQLSDEIYLLEGEQSTMAYPWAFLQTRPLILNPENFGGFKRLFDVIARFQVQNFDEPITTIITKPLFGFLYNWPAIINKIVTVDPVKYGLLYNWYAATDARLICADGWEVPEKADFDTLVSYLGGLTGMGGKIKETGLLYWNSPNTGATNEVGFNGRGNGQRPNTGIYAGLTGNGLLWSITVTGLHSVSTLQYSAASANAVQVSVWDIYGLGIRPIKTTTSLTHGQTGIYIGNDGKVYRTICIGTQEWLADHLAETKFRNGDYIPGYDGGTYTPFTNEAWAALTTPGVCAYNDDINNV